MEVKSSSTSWLKKNQQNATDSLRTIISFCSADPWKVWTQTILAKARDEGLSLLKIIASDFPLPQERVSSMPGTFEGIQTEQVAKAIAELECLVIGKLEGLR
ncbi:hypothetical protein DAPPUDRAFT_251634 [Daphnia pulex]|uniref:Uncharacterized protein n=1 Tax=Daphnia pulex TaxID=6669 RepID=E9H0T5_DAPPU|nr:hypothetical protein DAPPUDRAFT_251634 [Daphnia pulex]|eukprot:EFX74646.1 hypothetical protein DAPPUDRAFT_251634 [Daphnia pulex]